VLGKAKCANCALAEKQKNAGGEKIKSFRVGLCVVLLHFMSVCIVIVIIFFLSNVSLSGLQCLFTIAYNGGGMASKGLRSDVPINRDERLMRVMNFVNL